MYAMLGLIPITAYMIDPTAARYGMFFICCFSLSVEGDMAFFSIEFGSMGVSTQWLSMRLNRSVMMSIYMVCNIDMVRASLSHSIFIPRSQGAGPRSINSKYFCRSNLVVPSHWWCLLLPACH